LLPKLCISACVLNLWHCARLFPLSCVFTHALEFCLSPVIFPVSWDVICPALPMSCVVKHVLSPTALYKPNVKLNTRGGTGGCTDCSPIADVTLCCPVHPKTTFNLTRVLTNKHTCNFHISKNQSYVLNKNLEVFMRLLEDGRVSSRNNSTFVAAVTKSVL